MRLAAVICAVLSLVFSSASSASQAAVTGAPLRVFIDCEVEGCDFDFFRTEIDTTIFNKISEIRPDQTLTLSLGLKQPWGSVNASLEGASYLDNFSKNRAELFNSLELRLFKGFSVNMFVSASRVRDQLYLAKGESSDEDVLVRQRQLATPYSYFAGVGVSYTFGSVLNNVVNPRFEGASGGSFFFF